MTAVARDTYREYFAWLQTPEPEEGVIFAIDPAMPAEGYRIRSDGDKIRVTGGDDAGVLYGAFALRRRLASGQDINHESAPRVSRRILNHWDNIDGSIERGYAGRSIFFRNGRLDYDPVRIKDYVRLLASIGINVVSINNVNVTPESAKLLTDLLPEVKKLADIFRPWGVKLSLAVHFESPVLVGGLKTADPLEESVKSWWKERADEIYRLIPDFSGFLVKADSEFEGGPASFGRTEADGANLLARVVAPYGGVVYWRCFIYNCRQDWRDGTIDRPRAAYELFKPQDGLFDSNVILQIKNGPSDFQIREPNSPLLGAMEHTRQALEFQITQEYTGQQIDVCYLASQWEEVLSFPVDETAALRDLIGGKIDTVAAVANVGDNENWTGHTLAQANLYAFGRLAWDPALTAAEIAGEWVRLTFGNEPETVGKISDILLRSRNVYEKYTTPLGLGWMVNVHNHYGPSPEGYEYMKWGTYHRASHSAIGIDRTGRGTGFSKQYHPSLAARFDDVDSCPQELLLFFHRLPYSHVLKNGKTLLQHYYDTHFEGVLDVEDFISQWQSLERHLPKAVFESVAGRLVRQLENAREWRDVVNTYFYRKTGIPDEKGRPIHE